MKKEKINPTTEPINIDYRCPGCHKLFFKGNLKQAYIEIRCKYCKKTQIINI